MVKVKKTERTYRKDLIKELEKRLPKELTIFDEVSIRIPEKGTCKIPDLIILDKNEIEEIEDEIIISSRGIISIIETKKGAEKIHAGFLQVMKYVQLIKEIGGSPKSCFSTDYIGIIEAVFKNSIAHIDDARYGSSPSDQTIKEISIEILNIINEVRIPPKAEFKDELLLDILETGVDELTFYTKHIDSIYLEKLTGLFFAKTLNPKIMEDEELIKDFNKVTARAASYILINQIMFYVLLSSESDKYSKLTDIDDPKEMVTLFSKVLDDDYAPIFGANIAVLLPKESKDILNQLIHTVHNLGLHHIKYDIMGKVFHNLIPEKIRKRIAAYYTKTVPGELLARLSIKKSDDVVLDPSCGSGTLLVASYKRKKELYGISNSRIHKKILKEIYGIDICLFAGHLAAVHLSLQEPLTYTDHVSIWVEDSFNLFPGYKPLSIDEILIKDKLVIRGRPLPPSVDVLIMNPPFTNLERMSKKYVSHLKTVLKRQKKEKWVGGRGAGLNLLFILHGDGFIKKGGRMAAVLPASMLDYVKTTGFHRFLLEGYSFDYIITSEAHLTFSEQCDWKEMLLVATKDGTNLQTKFINFKIPLNFETLNLLHNKITSINTDYEDKDIRIRIIQKETLKETPLWSKFFRTTSIFDELKENAQNKLVKGEDIFGNAKVGIEAFGVDFFYLPNKYWDIKKELKDEIIVINRFTEIELTLPKQICRKALGKPQNNHRFVFPKTNHYLLTIPNKLRLSLPTDVQKYITWAEKNYSEKELTARKRFGDNWYSHVGDRAKSEFGRVAISEKFLPTTKANQAHYISENTIGTKTYYFVTTGDSKLDKALVAWYNSSIGLLYRYKNRMILGKGSERILGRHIELMECLNVREIKSSDLNKIISDIEEFKKFEPLPILPKQLDQKYRRRLDKHILLILGIKTNEIDFVLDKIYDEINVWINEIENRKKQK